MPTPAARGSPRTSGWDARLWRRWIAATALAYTIILAAIVAITSLGLDLTHVAVDHRTIGTLLIATGGAGVYGVVLGRLQWRVLRDRIPISPRSWVRACAIPAVVIWIAVVVPAAVQAQASGGNLRVAYFLALSQALAFGPLVGFAQARALRPFTTRWAWWIAANLVSWLIVDAVFWLVSLLFGAFDFAHGEGSPAEAYVLLLAATPLSARWLLWVTAPGAAPSAPPEPARMTAVAV